MCAAGLFDRLCVVFVLPATSCDCFVHIYLAKWVYFLPRLPRVVICSLCLRASLANSHLRNKVLPRSFQRPKNCGHCFHGSIWLKKTFKIFKIVLHGPLPLAMSFLSGSDGSLRFLRFGSNISLSTLSKRCSALLEHLSILLFQLPWGNDWFCWMFGLG